MSDYIKREDAKDALREKVFSDYSNEFYGAMQVLDELPSADVVERKRGNWVACTKDGLYLTELMRKEGKTWYGYRCTDCNFIYKGNALKDFNFCPNCGAEMRAQEAELCVTK